MLGRKDVCVFATIQHQWGVVLIAAFWDLRWKRDIAIPIHAPFHPNYVLEAHEMSQHLSLMLFAVDMGLVKVCLPVLFVGSMCSRRVGVLSLVSVVMDGTGKTVL